MLHTLTVCAPLGFGIFLSPEVVVIGLILASDQSHPKANTLGYFLGSALGILLLLGLGYFLTHSAEPTHPSGFSWWLRVVFGSLLVGLGIHTGWKQMHPKPKPAHHKENSLGAKLMKLLPVSEAPRPGGPLPSLGTCWLLSFLLTVVHMKTVGLAMAAGHQLHAAPDPSAFTAGAVGFLSLALFPTLFPLGLAVFYPETAVKARQVSESVAAKHGGWILSPISYLLSPISYLLSPISYLLSPISYLLSPISYLLSPISYLLSPISYLLSPI